MGILFTPQSVGHTEIKNRFVHSATHEGMAKASGNVSDRLIKRYHTLAKGGVGLIIPGFMYVHPLGRAYARPTGIHSDEMIQGLKKLVEAVHQEGAKIFFQLNHAGRQTSKDAVGQTPLAPSAAGRDPIYFFKPRQMDENHIAQAVSAFGDAAQRAFKAGADGIQVHGAHGYLVNQFLSPFFNHRTDAWGGSAQNRFLFLKKVILDIKAKTPDNFPVAVKLNTCDYTPKQGITPPMAAEYAGWLKDLGIDMLEISCGTSVYSYMNMCRGRVPVRELVQSFPFWKKPVAKLMISSLKGKYDLEEGYNLKRAEIIKPVLGNIPLCLVGGMRTLSKMEEAVTRGRADFISMSRPFIREPFIVNKFKEKKKERVSCVSCNRCLAAIPNGMEVVCYNKKFPYR